MPGVNPNYKLFVLFDALHVLQLLLQQSAQKHCIGACCGQLEPGGGGGDLSPFNKANT
jgi:hypothetical protein